MRIRTFRSAVLIGAGLFSIGLLPAIAAAQDSSQEQTAPAQQQAPAPGARMRGHGKMLGSLNLTDDQQAQINKIREDAKAKTEAVKTDSSLSDADKRAKIRTIHRDSMKQMRAVLTPEQRQQLREKMKERRAARGQQQPS